MRRRDPRRLLSVRRRAPARVKILEAQSGHEEDGSITSRQTAQVTLPRRELDKIWTPEYLERLARTYWRFLTRVSLGLLRVVYTDEGREIVVLTRPFVLLSFHKPEYEIAPDQGTVTWRIDRGLLVAPGGRDKGYLRISVQRPLDDDGSSDLVTSTVTSGVNFYPLIAGWGWFTRIGRAIYRVTQLRIHVIVTHAFLRSLARLDLAASKVGAMLPEPAEPESREPMPRQAAGRSPTQ
jgi:hypothetical protein